MTIAAIDPRTELYDDLAEQSAWRDGAACLGVPEEVFFPTRGESVDEAKAICAQCPVLVACREFALARVIRVGVFGGMSERERRRERHQRMRERAGLARLTDTVTDPVELAEARLGVTIAPAYRCAALWPKRRAPRRVTLWDGSATSRRLGRAVAGAA